MDHEEQAMLASSLREVFADPAVEVDVLLADLGWDDVVNDDPATASRLLFTAHGQSLSRAAVLDGVVLAELASVLPEPATAVCYPLPESGWQPSATADAVTGLLLRVPTDAERVVVPVLHQGRTTLAVMRAGELTATPVRTIDAELEWHTVTGRLDATASVDGAWESAVGAAHRALAAELIALAAEVLRLGVEHTSARVQFGAPISTFQAVRHRLADAYVAITAATALLDAAFVDGSRTAAKAAKAQAGRTHELVSANVMQVCGAMGATYEHPLHRYVARGAAYDALLGRWDHLAGELGEILTSMPVPRLVEV
jgi:hypothetical protein